MPTRGYSRSSGKNSSDNFPEAQMPRLLLELAALHTRVAESSAISRAGSEPPRDRILAAGEQEQVRLVFDFVAGQVAKTLGISPTSIDREQPISQMGLDSLMGIELKNAIESALNVEIPLDQFTAETSVNDLSETIRKLLGVEGAVEQHASVDSEATPAAGRSLEQIQRRIRCATIPRGAGTSTTTDSVPDDGD